MDRGQQADIELLLTCVPSTEVRARAWLGQPARESVRTRCDLDGNCMFPVTSVSSAVCLTVWARHRPPS